MFRKNLNMKQLAEQVGINYKTLNTLVNEDGRLMNPKQLALFSKYTGKSKQEVFYDNLKDDDLSDACTKTALLYIGKKTCEGWIANIDIRLDTKYQILVLPTMLAYCIKKIRKRINCSGRLGSAKS